MRPQGLHVDVGEQSPLISPQPTPDREDEDHEQLSESLTYQIANSPESKSSWYLFLLTLCLGGLQIVWSVEMSNGSPYLLSLGMSKSVLAFVWIAGPLSGVLVQPYVGIRSDNCRISWGKRRPFMIGGGAATIVALMALAWCREIVQGTLGLFGADPASKGVKVVTIVVATIFMYVLDFAINTVQAGIRAFIVDNAPAHQQESANGWASRITGFGNIVGYLFGYVNLPERFPFFGNTQFKVLCVIASIALSSTLLISCLYVKERDPRLEGPPATDNPGLVSFFKQVFNSIRRMPLQIRKICEVQFFSWIGWFPFLFYITTYIGQLYVNPHLEPGLSDGEIDQLWEKATRVGTLALLIYAITSLAGNIIFPVLIVPTHKPVTTDKASASNIRPSSPISTRQRSSSFGDLPYNDSTAHLSVYLPTESRIFDSTTPTMWNRFLTGLQIPGLTLRRLWLIAQILFAVCMASTFFIRTPTAATVMTAVVGISWSLTVWAPFALISGEVARRAEVARRKRRPMGMAAHATDAEDSVVKPGDDSEAEGPADQAGVILGLHNVAISSPQILATLISSVVFKALQKPRGVPGDQSLAWVLRIGGVSSLIAAAFTSQLGESMDEG